MANQKWSTRTWLPKGWRKKSTGSEWWWSRRSTRACTRAWSSQGNYKTFQGLFRPNYQKIFLLNCKFYIKLSKVTSRCESEQGVCSMTAFLILSPPANTLSCDVIMHAVHFGGQESSYLPYQRLSYLWLKKRGREREIWINYTMCTT